MQENRGEREIHCGFEVGVGKDDVGILPAEFQCDPFDGRRGRRHHPGARGDTAGERHHVHVRVLRQRRAGGGPSAENEIGDAGWQARFLQRPHQKNRGRGRQLTRLEHEGVARQQSRCHLPNRLQQRVIPGGDQSADADRLVDEATDRIRPAGVHHAPGFGAADACVVAQARHDIVHVVLGFDDPLARVERLGADEILAVALDQIGGAPQHVRPFAFRRVRPRARVEGFARRGNRGMGVLGGCLGGLCDQLTVGRTSDFAASPIERRAPFTRDVQIQVFCQRLGLSPSNVSVAYRAIEPSTCNRLNRADSAVKGKSETKFAGRAMLGRTLDRQSRSPAMMRVTL